MENKGYRNISGKCFTLHGTVSDWTPEGAKEKAVAEAKLLRESGFQVRLIKYVFTIYQVWVL